VDRLKDRNKAAEILTRKGDYFVTLRRFQEALREYRNILQNYSDTQAATNMYFAMGTVYEEASKPDSAIAMFRRQWRTYPGSSRTPDAIMHAGDLRYQQGDYATAVDIYERVLRDYSKDESVGLATYKSGLAFLQMEDYDQARMFFRSVIDSEWGDHVKQMARIGLARVELQAKQYPDARALLNTVLSGTAGSRVAAEAQYLMGESYKQQGDYNTAVIEYLKTKYLYGSEKDWVVKSVFNAAECNVSIDQIDNARRLYKSIISDFPSDTTFTNKSRQRLEDLMGKG